MQRILVIDDDEIARNLVSMYLTRAGYAVEESVDGMEALAQVSSQPPALIVCDIQMPGLDGYGLLSALRTQPATEAIPLIFLTGHADHQGFRKSMKLGADD